MMKVLGVLSAVPTQIGFLGLHDTQSVSSCCARLSTALPDGFAARSAHEGSSYELWNSMRWSNTSILAPSCIVMPSTTEEVSRVVKVLTEGGCPFAVKSGGHNPNPGDNSIDQGVAIDLSRLDSTSLSDDRKYVRLGSGATWGKAYDDLEKEGIAFPGGICEGVGVGGVALGGGQSLFQPKLGWVIDSILNYEVVLASGAVINANQTHHAGLFKALKGGGSNFGIVTKVDVAAFKHDGIWGGQVTVPAFSWNVKSALLALTKFNEEHNSDTASGAQLVIAHFHSGTSFVNMGLTNTDGVANPKVLRPFLNMWPRVKNTIGRRTVGSFVHEVSKDTPTGYRELTATTTFANDAETILAVNEATQKLYQELKHVRGLDWIYNIIPQPRSMHRSSAVRGGNSLGLSDVGHDQIVFWLFPRWVDAEHDDIMYRAAETWVAEVERITKSLGTYDPFLYHNAAGKFQKPLCGYGSDSVEFLQQVADEYDPNGVFQKLLPGGFKLSKAC